jgi:ribosome-associated protein
MSEDPADHPRETAGHPRETAGLSRPAAPIRITGSIFIDPSEIHESFVRAGGPGGQHVNTTSTAVQLRFDVRGSPSLPDDGRRRLERLAGSRLTRDGVLVLQAQGHRSQKRNREEALARLVELVRAAAVRPVLRKPTKPSRASKQRRLEHKKKHGALKALRQSRPD